MDAPSAAARAAWQASRWHFAAFWLGSLLASWLILRLVLFLEFSSPASGSQVVRALLVGLGRDVVPGLWLTLPLLGWLLLLPEHCVRPRAHRISFWSVCLLFWLGHIFLLFTEYFFFDEFDSRLNTVALDYLQYPTEVFTNLWESYHVATVFWVCLGLAAAWVWWANRLFAGAWEQPWRNKSRLLRLTAVGALAGALAPILLASGSLAGMLRSPFHFKRAHVSNDRVLNEIANNGLVTLFEAALTHHLEYGTFYQTLPQEEAYGRVRRLFASPRTQFTGPANSLCRQVAGDLSQPRLNVVILLIESFGSEFWGCLGRPTTLTPEMDRLAAEEGLLFTHLYASGNRTIRGLEGVLASFPPLPGESIVKRDRSDHVETIGRLLQRDDYATVFLYGGRGLFDGMRSFALRNGYDRFIERKHFEKPTFATGWGVCDEDLYARALEEFRELSRTGKPFLGTVLSVSNHKPYTYPQGKIPEKPEERRREHAVKYSDYALGEFFRKARKEAFWTNTVFAVVADHGARVYGSQSIPLRSYAIPLLLVGPAVIDRPGRVGQLGGSLDVAPTLLGLLGRPYQSTFMGQDLLKSRPEAGRAWLNHNRNIGLLTPERLVVLGLLKAEEFFTGEPKLTEMKALAAPEPSDRELQNEAIAFYQVADDLYMQQRYRVDVPARAHLMTAGKPERAKGGQN